MAVSRDTEALVGAINRNTRAIESLTKAVEKAGKVKPVDFTQIFSGGSPEPLELDKPEYDTPQ